MQVKNFKGLVAYILKKMNGDGPIEVWDADSACTRYITPKILVIVEDTVGLAKTVGSSGIGSYVGCCPYCTVEGCRGHKTACYISAIAHTPLDCPMRKEFADEFEMWPDVRKMCEPGAKPAKMTTPLSLASASRVLSGASRKEDEPFPDTDAATSVYPGFDKIRRSTADGAHGIMHAIKDLAALVTNEGQMKLKPPRLEKEHIKGRFTHITNASHAPWRASGGRIAAIDELCAWLKVT
jgi:hypothetical protein